MVVDPTCVYSAAESLKDARLLGRRHAGPSELLAPAVLRLFF